MLFSLLFLVQSAQSDVSATSPDTKSTMTYEQATAALAEIKLTIDWNDKTQAYNCSVKKGSGIDWADPIPCAAIKKCETGKMQKPEALMSCVGQNASVLVKQAIESLKF